jgi:primosomal protein N' (replication factor Y)
VGIIAAVRGDSSVPADRLRHATEILDDAPLLDDELRRMLEWAAGYYQHPLGEVYAAALPVLLRRGGNPAEPETRWHVTDAGRRADAAALARRAPLQARILDACLVTPGRGASGTALSGLGRSWRTSVAALETAGLLERRQASALLVPDPAQGTGEPGPDLTPAQAQAVDAINAANGYGAFLLEGITGSGKTEVYLACIEARLAEDRQSLVLVPEIGLTPQLVERFERRLAVPLAVMHSGLSDGDRLRAWGAARDGSARVVIGTRSAVFTPLLRPGLIIVDEEHDPSFKQQDGFRYSARDLAIWRARQLDVAVVLGSATPSFESVENARAGRYQRLELPERPGAARPPAVRLVDLRTHPARDGLTEPLLGAIQRHLDDGGQVLLYLNRRGFSPALVCSACGHVEGCRRCDARMVFHRQRARLVCHHCNTERAAPEACPDCGQPLRAVGQGTERLETALGERFPDVPLVRIDRDTTRRRGEIERRLELVSSGSARILLGTQMLAKGHDFPEVTLVGVIDADQGLFGTDFRSSERLAQTLVQVAGRAGRAARPGEVYVQTLYPEHPLLTTLIRDGYDCFATQAMEERRAAGWPPFGYIALLRAEATGRAEVFDFLGAALSAAGNLSATGVQLLGPAPAPMERRSGRFRGQLLIRADRRGALQRFLQPWRHGLTELKSSRKVRWSLDVDPAELF